MPTADIIVTMHAIERWQARVASAANHPGGYSRLRAHIADQARRATPLKERTAAGDALWDSKEAGCTFVVKRDKGKFWVVSVLSRAERLAQRAKANPAVAMAEEIRALGLEEEEKRLIEPPPLPDVVRGLTRDTVLRHIEGLETYIRRLKETNRRLNERIATLEQENRWLQKEAQVHAKESF